MATRGMPANVLIIFGLKCHPHPGGETVSVATSLAKTARRCTTCGERTGTRQYVAGAGRDTDSEEQDRAATTETRIHIRTATHSNALAFRFQGRKKTIAMANRITPVTYYLPRSASHSTKWTGVLDAKASSQACFAISRDVSETEQKKKNIPVTFIARIAKADR